MMRIGYDLRRIGNPGIGRYMRQLVEAMVCIAPENEYVLIVAPGNDVLPSVNGSARLVTTNAPYYSVIEQVALPKLARECRLDLLHSPHFLMPILCPCPVLVTIHDCIYITCPEDLGSYFGRTYYRAMMHAAVRRSRHVITDSEHSKRDIIRLLKCDDGKITVVPCGVDERFQPVSCTREQDRVRHLYGIEGDFVFFTAIYKERKNHSGLLDAFALLRAMGLRAQLVLGGPLGEGEAVLRAKARTLGVEDDVRLIGFIPDTDLAALYTAASLYACPSTYEGFGFTILEAMSCGTPVVCHPGTSLPEVGGNAPVYANACDPEEFAFAMHRLLTDHNLRQLCIGRGLARARQFSWRNTARGTLNIYEEVVNQAGVLRCA